MICEINYVGWHKRLGTVCLATGILVSCDGRQVADAVYNNAGVITMSDSLPEAEAMAVAGDMILAVGSYEDMDDLIGVNTNVYDVSGRTILPGINESHIHVRDLGFEQHYAVNVETARNVAEIQQQLRTRLEQLSLVGELGDWRYPTTGEVGDWLFGLGWTQDRLSEHRMANRHELDEVSKNVPISLTRIYRGIAVNTKVFELLGIDFEDPATFPEWFTTDPPDFEAGDIIFRDPEKPVCPTGCSSATEPLGSWQRLSPRRVSNSVSRVSCRA